MTVTMHLNSGYESA